MLDKDILKQLEKEIQEEINFRATGKQRHFCPCGGRLKGGEIRYYAGSYTDRSFCCLCGRPE